MLFPIIALVLCVVVLAYDWVCAVTAGNPLPGLVYLVTLPAIAGVLLASAAVVCAVWWPPVAFWMALASCAIGAGPILLLWMCILPDAVRGQAYDLIDWLRRRR